MLGPVRAKFRGKVVERSIALSGRTAARAIADAMPFLERAKAVDLSYEWYIGPASYIAVAAFYKKLDNYIYTRVLPLDFSGFPLPSTAVNITNAAIINAASVKPDSG